MADLARIKNNVRKMVEQKAPEADIDGYIASEGVTVDDVRNFTGGAQQPQPDAAGYGMDMLKSAASGLRSGVEGMAGAVGSTNQMTGQGMGWLAGKMGASPHTQDFVSKVGRRMSFMPFMPTTEEVAGATDAGMKAIPGAEQAQEVTRHQPQTTPGKYVRTVAEFAPNMALGPGGAGRKVAMTLGSGLASEAAGQATEGTAAEPYARVAGAVVGGVATAGGGAKGARNVTEETLARLNKNKNDAYALSEKAGVIIKPQGMKDLYKKVADDFAEHAADPGNEPGAHRALARIEKDLNNNVTLKGLDTIRKMAGNSYEMGNKSNNALVAKIVKRIDELIDSNNPDFMAGIDTAIGTKAIDVARQFAHRAFKLETVTNLIKKGVQQADRNITDTAVKSVKTQLAKLNDPLSSWGRGFNKAELASAEKAAKYTSPQRSLHGISVMNPFFGGKLTAAGHLGAAANSFLTGNIPALALQGVGAIVGMGAQKAAHALAKKSVDEFVDLVARGGVPEDVVKSAIPLLSPPKRAAVIRALAASGQTRPPLEITVGQPADK